MKQQMNECLQILHDQIGRAAFFMMGTRHIVFNNQKNTLQWQISGSSVSSVRVAYCFEQDLYEVAFITETAPHPSEIVLQGIEASELHETIERMTGLSLSIPRIRFAGR